MVDSKTQESRGSIERQKTMVDSKTQESRGSIERQKTMVDSQNTRVTWVY